MAQSAQKIGLVVFVCLIWPATYAAGAKPDWSSRLAEPVQNVTFDPVNTKNATFREIVIFRRGKDTLKIKFDPTATTATVAGGNITVAEFTVSNSNGDTVTFDLNPASLSENAFGAFFADDGVAHAHTNEDEDIPVKYSGTIIRRGDTYRLRINVVGFLGPGGGGRFDLNFVNVSLNGTAAVPAP